MPEILHIAVEQKPDAHIVSVVGEVDLATAPRLDEAAGTAIRETTTGVVILDLTGVTFLSSSGISVLLQTRKHSVDSEVVLRIVVGPGAARRALEICGLRNELIDCATVEAALDGHEGHARSRRG